MDLPDWERLDRYVAGEGTPEQLEALRRWVEADPELQAIAEALRTAQRLPGSIPPRWELRTAWQSIAHRLGLDVTPLHTRIPPLHAVERGSGGEDPVEEGVRG